MTPRHVRVGIHYATDNLGNVVGWFCYCHQCAFNSSDCKSYGAALRKAHRHAKVCKQPQVTNPRERNEHMFGVITAER